MLARTLTTTTAAASASSSRFPLSPYFSFSSPLTRASLSSIRKALVDNYKHVHPDQSETHAAVLIPLCNVNNVPGILFEVRGKLRTHSGETDASLLHAALRETREEVGIHPEQIEILGQVGPPQRSLGGMRVWPFVGFVYPSAESRNDNIDDADAPLPSLSMSSLSISHPEVANAFHLPFSEMISPARLRTHLFRGDEPCWAITVSDIVDQEGVGWASDPAQRDEIGGDRGERLEVWGLTGWYLSLLMKVFEVYR
ncbi:hypothetical protein EW146_g6772 [Bondarzewia mesenterica]|uniref:Nudix hydrolase domain-containing protein n=1 Tax=Bondarzewia mesenterica TaxID=1095465 RepID=A0A4S4LMK7_9AGAM|nr:hypothetical protein EW146_g6772 [Bondarzewia mesenterica]